MAESNSDSCRALFLSHGGGPLPLLDDKGHEEMVENLMMLAARISKPSAILVISAHWESNIATITSNAKPSLIYDYYGFPEESYNIQYPAPGNPDLAEVVFDAVSKAGLPVKLDPQRGFDHGLFVPLKIMYPKADIPCVQLSLLSSLNAKEHLELGSSLANLDQENLLIIGSGFSFHNMHAFFSQHIDESSSKNVEFERWLIETMASLDLDEANRVKRLENWENAPSARYCHPREEHLLPLHVCYGAMQKPCDEYYELKILNKQASVYLW